MAKRITGRKEDKSGANSHYQINKREVVTRAQAVRMVKKGELPGYHTINVKGTDYLRDNPDLNEKDNINKQPIVK